MTDSKVEKINQILDRIKSDAHKKYWNYTRVQEGTTSSEDGYARDLLAELRREGVPEHLITQINKQAEKISSQTDWHILGVVGVMGGILGGGFGSACGYIAKTGSYDLDLFGVIMAGVIGGYILLGGAGYLAGSALNSIKPGVAEFEQYRQDVINAANGNEIQPASEIEIRGSINSSA